MPAIRRRNHTLAELFVFYDRLATDFGGINIDLYNAAKNSFDVVSTEIGNIIQSGAIIRKIGENEAKKEQNLLKYIFNANITVDFTNKDSIKQFVDALNKYLNLKEVYERNVFLIANSKGKKSVISFFPTYFLKVWDRRWEDISKKIEVAIDGKEKENILEIIKEIVHPEIEDIIPIAIKEMFEAERELKKTMPEEMKNAYKQLIDVIGTVNQAGSLAHRIAQIYQLDRISEFLTEAIKEGKNEEEKIKGIKKTAKANTAQKGRLSLEAIENTVFNMIADGLHGQIKGVHVYYSGKKETGFKADNIISFGIDPEIIQEALETNEAVSRERNKKLFDELGEKLKNIKDGYIVYSSDKNYTYNKGFEERGGFKAEGISLETYQHIMKYTVRNARTFVGTILQTAEGAIGDPRLKEDLEKAMAQDVAYFLFDDFKTIGNEVGAGDTSAIHVMNLNGVLIPLSLFLIMFANAIEEEVGNPEDYVKVDISVPAIEFKTQEEQQEWQRREGKTSFDAWTYQRGKALAESKIEVHFLRSFKSFITQFLT